MRALTVDEKTTTVMVYSSNKLVHGELITRQTLRVSILPRMQALGNYLQFLKAQVWFFGGGEPRVLKYSEYFFPVNEMAGFHVAPPSSEPLDYEDDQANRAMTGIDALLGVFVVKGKLRTSKAVELGGNLELAYKSWLSIYDADICSPFLPQMPVIHVPMLLVSPPLVSFGNSE